MDEKRFVSILFSIKNPAETYVAQSKLAVLGGFDSGLLVSKVKKSRVPYWAWADTAREPRAEKYVPRSGLEKHLQLALLPEVGLQGFSHVLSHPCAFASFEELQKRHGYAPIRPQEIYFVTLSCEAISGVPFGYENAYTFLFNVRRTSDGRVIEQAKIRPFFDMLLRDDELGLHPLRFDRQPHFSPSEQCRILKKFGLGVGPRNDDYGVRKYQGDEDFSMLNLPLT